MQKFSSVFKECLPSAAYLVLYALLAALLVAIYNLPTIGRLYNFEGDETSPYAAVGAYIQSALQWLNDLESTELVVTFIVCALIALILFMVVQAAAHLIEWIHDDSIFLTKYIHPTGFSQRQYWRYRFVSTLELWIMLLLALLFAIVTIAVIIPNAGLFTATALTTPTPLNIVFAIAWYAGLVAGFAAVHTTVALVFHRYELLNEIFKGELD